MEDDDERIIPKTSKINSGMLQVIRLDYLWRERHKHARRGDYLKWNEDLDSVWCELSGDAKSDDEKEYIKLDEAFAKTIKNPAIEKRGFSTLNKEEKISLIKQKKALINKEIFLRKLQNKQGKGTAYEEEDDFE